jgi:hypothetical protein
MTKAVVWNDVSMLTLGMKNLGNQFNAAFPKRDGTSDGAVGDYAHSQGHSGHNPDDTSKHNAEWDGDSDSKSEVRAIDVDDDLNDPEVTMQDVINHMRKLPNLSKVIRYMIYNKKIYKASNGFAAETYSGASPHTEHAHFSGAYSDASDKNNTFDYKFEELVMPTAAEIATAVWAYPLERPDSTATPKAKTSAGTYQRWNDVVNDASANKVINALTPAITAIAAKVDLAPAELAAIKAALEVPTAAQNAEATVTALLGGGVSQLAIALRTVLSTEDLDKLISELS